MKSSTLSKLTFLVAFGLLVLFGRNVLGRYQQQQPNEYLKAVQGIKPEDIVRIELLKDSQTTVLTKDGIWKVASRSADSAKVNELIGALLPKTSPQLISENKDKFSELEISGQQAFLVKLITQNGEKQFEIGKRIGSATAVMFNGTGKVYGLASVPELTVLPQDWTDKVVLDIDSSQIKQISFSGKESFILNQAGDRQWVFEGSNEKVNSDGVITYAYKFNPLKADGIASEEQKNAFNLSSAGFTVSVTDNNNAKTDMMFKLIKGMYVVRRSSDSEYFTLDKSTGDSFEKLKLGFVAS